MLTGPSLSIVQMAALHVLDNDERATTIREGVRQELLSIKRAILTAMPKLGPVLFPEWLGDSDGEGGIEPPPTLEPPTPDEVAEMEAWVRQATQKSGASMSGAELLESEPQGGWV